MNTPPRSETCVLEPLVRPRGQRKDEGRLKFYKALVGSNHLMAATRILATMNEISDPTHLPAFLSALQSIAQVFRSLSLEKTYVKAGMVKRV